MSFAPVSLTPVLETPLLMPEVQPGDGKIIDSAFGTIAADQLSTLSLSLFHRAP